MKKSIVVHGGRALTEQQLRIGKDPDLRQPHAQYGETVQTSAWWASSALSRRDMGTWGVSRERCLIGRAPESVLSEGAVSRRSAPHAELGARAEAQRGGPARRDLVPSEGSAAEAADVEARAFQKGLLGHPEGWT